MYSTGNGRLQACLIIRCGMNVIQNNDKTWRVDDVHGRTLASGLTNAQAWCCADIRANEHLSRAENVSDWVAKKSASECAE